MIISLSNCRWLARCLLLASVCAVSSPTRAQVPPSSAGGGLKPLPPIWNQGPESVEEAYAWWLRPAEQWHENGVRPVGYDVPLATPLIQSDSPLYENTPTIDGPRDGIFQNVKFAATYLPGGNFSNFGITDTAISTTLAFPLPSRERPLVITPGFAAYYLEGPPSLDLPPRLFDAWLRFRFLGKITESLGYDVAVTPGYYSDGQNGDSQSFRLTGYGFGAYEWSDSLQFVLGVIYLNRQNVRMLPAAGLIWTPIDDMRFELVVPKPRIANRIYGDDEVEHWIYIAGEYGGGTWAIDQAGTPDVLTYSDFRVMFGWEKKTAGGVHGLFEIGYVFGRELEFDSGAPSFEPTDTLMVRAGARY